MPKHIPCHECNENGKTSEVCRCGELPVDNVVINSLPEYTFLGKEQVFYKKEDVEKVLQANDRTAIELLADIKCWDVAQAVKLERRVKLALPVELRKRIQNYLSRADLSLMFTGASL